MHLWFLKLDLVHGSWEMIPDGRVCQKRMLLDIVERSLEYGINFFDTAPIYGHGTGEARLGKALKGVDRSKIVINTKFGRTNTGYH